jgi:predicted HD phosphohydrolase
MHERYRNRYRVQKASTRVRQQIALEAARRLFGALMPKATDPEPDWLETASSNDFYLAKRQAAAVLGHRIRPGDLPSDAEVREQLIALDRNGAEIPEEPGEALEPQRELAVPSLAEHLDRFALYRMRLEPLESVKQNVKYHPEGDALFHSLQVFQLARDARPYDEEFLLAALLHDVGKAIDPQDHVAAGVEALRGAVTDRTLWLIEYHMDLVNGRERTFSARLKRESQPPDYLDDLKLLRELDDAGRVPGEHVDSLDDVLDYLKRLAEERYLEETPTT